MLLRFLVFVFALGAMAPLAAASPSGAAERIRADVEYLASDLLEGRAAGTNGHALAAAFIASRMRAIGVEPAGENGGYVQMVPLRRATLVPASTVARIGEGNVWRTLGPEALRISPSLSQRRLERNARLLFVGYGLDEPALGLNDYEGLDARGKIILAFAGAPAGLGADIAAFVKTQKAAYATAHGAVGLIEIPAWPPSGGVGDLAPEVAQPVAGWTSKDHIGPKLGGELARLTISSRLVTQLFAGAPRSLAKVQRQALAGGRPAGFALRSRLAVTARSDWTEVSSAQLFARIPGRDPALRAQSILLVGHLDHLGRISTAARHADDIDNGALDNAVGVATLLEVARQLADLPQAMRRSAVLLITTGEELGALGADYAVDHLPAAAGRPVAALVLDMPLLLYHFTDIAAPGANHSALGPALAEAARPLGATLSPDPMPQQELIGRSDQLRFIERGVPSALLVTGFANGGQAAWADFLARHYHQPTDDLAQPIRWAEGARLASLVVGTVRRLADRPTAPSWNPGDFFARRSPGRTIREDKHGR